MIRSVHLVDFRSHHHARLSLGEGLTVVTGPNGAGKTNLLEAIGYVATATSFRGAPNEAMVRSGADRAVVRAEVRTLERELLVEAEIAAVGRGRVQVNRQRLARVRDLLGVLRVSVFSPDDLALVKGGPAERRRLLDDALVALHPRNDALRSETERVLRQRSTLLRQSKGRLDADAAATLDVWDAKLADVGGQLVEARRALVATLAPLVAERARGLAGEGEVTLTYAASWEGDDLAAALAAGRRDDVRRGVSTIGPHRDDLELRLDGLAARTQASQGEQRTVALALRLATHRVVEEATGAAPVLLLDDVFSELDADRAAALLAALPAGQALLTTAGPLPEGLAPEQVLRIDEVRQGA